MKYLPVYINMADKKILVIGGGSVALQKLVTILKFTNNVSVIAKEISDEVKALGVPFEIAEYSKKYLDKIDMVYACTNNRPLNRTIREEAISKKIWVNVVDDPEFCDFISPAVYSGDKFSIAVSTFGNSPSGAAHIRDRIKARFPSQELDTFVAERHRLRKKN